MSQYVDGFILSIPKAKIAAYKKLATKAGKIWREHGAIEYRESVGDDMSAKGMVAFPKLAKSKPGEVVIFAYAVFKSRQHRDATNKKIMADPRLAAMGSEASSIVNCKRMAYGGFKSLVEASSFSLGLLDQSLHHFSRHISQTEIAALKAIRESFVIKTEQMQNRRVKIVHVGRIFHDAPADLVRLADDLSAAHSAAGHPNAERKRMMIASTDAPIERRTIFPERRAAKF
jgi:uncharacterized protein YbaA (DUF1428 family)